MDKDKFLNFLTNEYQEAKSTLNSSGTVQELSSKSERYTNFSQFDEGGMKTIIKVFDQVTERHLVMATIKNEATKEMKEHFLREAKITASLQHPNIVPVHDIGHTAEGEPYFIMKLIEGQSVSQYLDKSLLEKLNIFLKICDAINYAHSQGIVHLDLKPDNIQVGKHGEVIVCDWGLAKVLYEDCNEEFLKMDSLDVGNLQLTLYGRGTPGYMAPEQFQKSEGMRKPADIYSLGAMLYAILTQKAPVSGDSYENIKKKTLSGQFKAPSLAMPQLKIPMGLEAICMKALSTKVEDRYKIVKELADDVQAYLNGFAPKAENAGFVTQLKLLYQRNKSLINLSAAALIFILLGLLWFIGEIKQRELEARTAYEKLSAEKELRKQTEQMALIRTVNKGWQEFKRGKYNNALEEAEISLNLEPKNVHALRLAGLIYLSQFEFLKAYDYFEKLPDERFFDLKLKTKAFLEVTDDIPFAKVIDVFTPEYLVVPYRNVIAKSFERATLEQKKELIKALILSKNENLLPSKIVLSEDGKSLTIKSKKFHTLPPLNKSGLKELDVSKTNLFKLNPLNDLKLKTLHFPYTNIGYMDMESGKESITDLNIEGTRFNHIPTNMGHLQILNIAHCKFGDYSKLVRFKELKKLTVNKDQLPEDIMNQLSCEIVIK